VWVLQSGLVINAFGNGAGNPFVWLYLHDVRGISLAVAGLAGSSSAVFSLGAAAVAGSLADRRGARVTMIAGLLVSACG
jgi:MFS family permease